MLRGEFARFSAGNAHPDALTQTFYIHFIATETFVKLLNHKNPRAAGTCKAELVGIRMTSSETPSHVERAFGRFSHLPGSSVTPLCQEFNQYNLKISLPSSLPFGLLSL